MIKVKTFHFHIQKKKLFDVKFNAQNEFHQNYIPYLLNKSFFFINYLSAKNYHYNVITYKKKI